MTSFRMRLLVLGVAGYLGICFVVASPALGQEQAGSTVELQREAMKKFDFLVGTWSGGVRWFPNGDRLELNYTEDVHYEQDGLVLRIEGAGRGASDGRLVIGGVDFISYDVQFGTYRIHGRQNQQEGALKIDEDRKGMTIDFQTPPQRTTRAVLRINDEGYWTEIHWVTEGSAHPWMFLAGVLRRQQVPPKKTGPPSRGATPTGKD